MKIELRRILQDDSLSVHRIRDMRPDEVITVSCDNVAEFNTSRATARNGKVTASRIDGFKYKIECSTLTNTITISLTKDDVED